MAPGRGEMEFFAVSAEPVLNERLAELWRSSLPSLRLTNSWN